MTNQKKKNVRARKLKYGAFAVTLTVVCVALVVLVNVIFSSLATKYLWQLDMTKEQLFVLSDAGKALLDDYKDDEDLNIKIIFCMPKDQIVAEYFYDLVYNCARQFELEYDFIEIEFRDVVMHPSSVDEFKTTAASKITTKHVIITNGSQHRLFTMEGFYTFDSESGELFAFNGEYKIISSILQIEGDNPIAYFVEGHGETNAGSSMYTLFEEAGFDVRTIDLSKEAVDPNARVMVINNPQYDFMGAFDSVNEIKKIDNFLDNLGNLMVFIDADESRDFPELETLLKEWGIEFGDALIRDYSNSLSVDGTELVSEYTDDGNTGSSLHSNIRKFDTVPKTIVNYARPIILTYDEYETRSTSAVLQTSYKKTAQAFPFGATDTEGIPGIYNLMVISTEERYIDNEAHYNFVLAAGTSSFAEDKYIGSNSYGNRDIIFAAMKNFGKKTVPMDLSFKVFDNEALDITTKEATMWTVICTGFLPLIVLICGIAMFIRRKHL